MAERENFHSKRAPLGDSDWSESSVASNHGFIYLCVYFNMLLYSNNSFPRFFNKRAFLDLQQIEEFTDVNEGEKEVMKLWNLHVMKHG